MQFSLLINCDNEAFHEPGQELARLLRRLAQQFEDLGLSDTSGPFRDFNGNKVGTWNFGTPRRQGINR